jgi:hypothetical protein
MFPGNAEGPGRPVAPEGPLRPIDPVGPGKPEGPITPVAPEGPVDPWTDMSACVIFVHQNLFFSQLHRSILARPALPARPVSLVGLECLLLLDFPGELCQHV